eukprot:CAMPEP_0175479300 /NCGR_PEP_ID=MMETSP0095-20121207/77376_1 /TAXON_ID=311494 /ORGANISM="Alexandrium monilatum, Strain CCMP3105" /LENGTH=43 /DNA_ID= /DNA_START= /DNA_END= /DNA_ORIENTATION=
MTDGSGRPGSGSSKASSHKSCAQGFHCGRSWGRPSPTPEHAPG